MKSIENKNVIISIMGWSGLSEFWKNALQLSIDSAKLEMSDTKSMLIWLELYCLYIVQFQIIVFSWLCYGLLCNHEYFNCLNHRQSKNYITRRKNKTESKL